MIPFLLQRPFGVNHDTPVDKAYNLFVSELVLELPTNISDNMVRLLKKFLQPDPMKRIWKLEHLKQQPTMKNMDFDEVNQKEIITAFIPSVSLVRTLHVLSIRFIKKFIHRVFRKRVQMKDFNLV